MIIIKKIFSYQSLLIVVLFFLVFWLYFKLGFNHWSVVAVVDKPQVALGWSEPQGLGLNTNQWETGVDISNDGNVLFFSFYPGDLDNDQLAGDLSDDIDVYYSTKPFVQVKKHALSEDQWSEGGAMMAGSDIYYMSNRNHLDNYDIYKNGQVIINTPTKSEQDPYFCLAQDELYFEVAGLIYVNKNNQTTALPFPINDDSQNRQPFLTSDCQTIYFASTRGDGVSKIFKSERLGENSWSAPELMVASRYGVGEPSLTADGQTMFFVQVLKSAKEVMNADIFYIDKIEK